MGEQEETIEIPVKGTSEVVEINLEDLPDVPDLIHFLTNEEAEPHLWLRLAVGLGL